MNDNTRNTPPVTLAAVLQWHEEAADREHGLAAGYQSRSEKEASRDVPLMLAAVRYARVADLHAEEARFHAEAATAVRWAMPPSWRPIEPGDMDTEGWLYSPPEALYSDPTGQPGDVRFGRPRDFCWATHIMAMARPAPPAHKIQGAGDAA